MSSSFEPKKIHCEHEGCPKPPQFRIDSTLSEFCKEHLGEHIQDGEKALPLLSGFKLEVETSAQIKAQKVSEKVLKRFIGKTMRMMCGTEVKIERIQGSVPKPTRFEVNSAYHIVMLDAFKQLNNDKSITQEMIDAFDQMIVEEIVPMAEVERRLNAQKGSIPNG